MPLNGKVYQDKEGQRLETLFVKENARYIIRHNYTFSDTLRIPNNSEIFFKGGSLSGPIVFQNTRLRGDVNLKGSFITGSLKNKVFEATWLCPADGISDDAASINDIISICDCIHFKKGIYRLKSNFSPPLDDNELSDPYLRTHIGINRNGIKLFGDEGAELVSDIACVTICVYSPRFQIENSIRNIEIAGLTFSIRNDGNIFHEYSHVIRVIGVNGLKIKKCVFNDFWGDAISLSHYGDDPNTGERTRNENVSITNNQILGGNHHNNRNGISVINGKNVLIKGNIIMNTSRNDMPGGIDIEPNNSAYTIENIRIENNIIEGVKGSGGAICVVIFNGGPAHDIAIIGNKISDCNNGLLLYVKTDGTSDNFIIKDNYVSSDTRPYRFTGEGKSKNWTISRNTFDRPCNQKIPGDIKVDKLTVQKNKKKE